MAAGSWESVMGGRKERVRGDQRTMVLLGLLRRWMMFLVSMKASSMVKLVPARSREPSPGLGALRALSGMISTAGVVGAGRKMKASEEVTARLTPEVARVMRPATSSAGLQAKRAFPARTMGMSPFHAMSVTMGPRLPR